MRKTRFTAAVIQLSAGSDVEANLHRAQRLARRAVLSGAEAVLFPECFLFRGPTGRPAEGAERLTGPSVRCFQALAREIGASVLMGSIYETIPGESRVYNTSVFIGPDGTIAGVYRKRKLFEAALYGKRVREADVFLAGRRAKMITVSGFFAGMAVCFDLRFPRLFWDYAERGGDLFFIPSNFTRETGRDHWETLLRARAIENRCYVLAPNQYGAAGGVEAYGNSMIIDPWGRILKRAGDSGEAILLAAIDNKEILKARKRLPMKQGADS